MAGDLQPLDEKFEIVGPDGRPTLYFIKWAQQRQIDIAEGITAEQALEIVVAYLAAHVLQEGSGIQITPSGNLSDNPTIAADVQEILDQITATRGSMLYRGAGGWAGLAPGVAGRFLKTNGAGADPAWAVNAVSTDWGDIGGTLSDQTDLQAELDGKLSVIDDFIDWGAGAVAVSPAPVFSVGYAQVEGAIAMLPSATDIPLIYLAKLGYVATGWLGSLTANSRVAIGCDGFATGWEFNVDPFVVANRIFHEGNLLAFTAVDDGLVPFSGGGTANFLRADGTWAAPGGGGGGTVTTSGAPAAGNLTKFSGGTAITNGDLSGDVSTSGTLVVTIGANKVTNGMLAQVASGTFKGRTTAGLGNVQDLTPTQATALLDTLVGDSGSGGTKGLVPAPAAGDAAAGKFLKADGTWAVGGSYTDEQAQDAIGTILVDTATIDLTYSDATPSITADVKAGSIGPTQLADTAVTPGAYTRANITVDADGRVTAAASGTGVPWTLAGSWTWSTNVASVAFTGLGSYDDLLIISRGITRSVSGSDRVCVSNDNGATYKSASGDYVSISAAGVETAVTGFSLFSTATTAIRSGVLRIFGISNSVAPKAALAPNTSVPSELFVLNNNQVNAVRVDPSAGGNLTAGSIWVFAR